jgi:hypothetical protein
MAYLALLRIMVWLLASIFFFVFVLHIGYRPQVHFIFDHYNLSVRVFSERKKFVHTRSTCLYSTQITFVTRAFANRGFISVLGSSVSYPRFYFSVMRSITILSAVLFQYYEEHQYLIRGFISVLWGASISYPRFYFSVVRSINILSAVLFQYYEEHQYLIRDFISVLWGASVSYPRFYFSIMRSISILSAVLFQYYEEHQYPIRGFIPVLWGATVSYPRFYFSVMRSINILSAVLFQCYEEHQYPIRGFISVLWGASISYPRFYFSIVRSINILSAVLFQYCEEHQYPIHCFILVSWGASISYLRFYFSIMRIISILSAVLFQYYEEHQYPIHCFISVLWGASISYPRPNFKAYFPRRTFSRLIRECDAHDKLRIKEFWRQYINMAIVICFPFYAFSLYAAIRKNATPVYNESRLCVGILFAMVRCPERLSELTSLLSSRIKFHCFSTAQFCWSIGLTAFSAGTKRRRVMDAIPGGSRFDWRPGCWPSWLMLSWFSLVCQMWMPRSNRGVK